MPFTEALGAPVRDEQLHAFLDAARARTAVDTRRRRRWLERQLEEDQTFATLCRAMLDAGARIELSVASGRTYTGVPVTAVPEFVAIATDDGHMVYIAAPALVGLRRLGDSADNPAAAPGRPTPVRAATFDDVVIGLSACRSMLDVGTVDGSTHHGQVAGVGRDLLWFDDGRYLRLDAVTEVATTP